MLSLIDTRQLARLATERDVDLRVPYGGNPLLDSSSEEEIAVLAAATKDNPLRIAVDPTEQAAGIAAMTLVDMLRIEGIEARVVENRMTSIVEEALPEGEVDAVISTADTSVTATNVASFLPVTLMRKQPQLRHQPRLPQLQPNQPQPNLNHLRLHSKNYGRVIYRWHARTILTIARKGHYRVRLVRNKVWK